MPKPARPHDVINDAARKGVSIGRFKISKADGRKILELEKTQGHDAAVAELLRVLPAKTRH